MYALVYIHDITIFLKISEEDLRHIGKVSKLLNNEKMTIKLKKCSFFSAGIVYLSYIIAPVRLLVAFKTMMATKSLQNLTVISDLQSFSKLCIVYRHFASNFANLASQIEEI